LLTDFGQKEGVDETVDAERVLAHQPAREIVAPVAARARGGEIDGRQKLGHGTTLGEIQFSIWAAASSSPMRWVAEKGSAASVPSSASSLRARAAAWMRWP